MKSYEVFLIVGRYEWCKPLETYEEDGKVIRLKLERWNGDIIYAVRHMATFCERNPPCPDAFMQGKGNGIRL